MLPVTTVRNSFIRPLGECSIIKEFWDPSGLWLSLSRRSEALNPNLSFPHFSLYSLFYSFLCLLVRPPFLPSILHCPLLFIFLTKPHPVIFSLHWLLISQCTRTSVIACLSLSTLTQGLPLCHKSASNSIW